MPLLAFNTTTSPLALAAGNPVPTLPAAPSVGALGAAYNVTGNLKPDLTVDPVNGVAGGLSVSAYTLLQAQVLAGQVQYQWTAEPEYLTALSSASSSLNGAITATSAAIVVTSAAGFPASGTLKIDLEYISYTSIGGGTTFNGLTRGLLGTAVASHANGSAVSAVGLQVGSAMGGVKNQAVAIYVNASTGSDNNPGTLSAPLASLEGAISTIASGNRKSCQVIFDADLMGTLGPQTPARAYGSLTGFEQLPRAVGGTNVVFIGARRTLVPAQLETSGASNQLLTGTMPATTISDNPLASGSTTINVGSTAAFPTSGVLQIESEIILYTGVTATSFTGCLRGYANTTAASHVQTTSIFLFMAGYCVRITDGITSATVSDNPLTATANTVNVNATAGYPSSGTIQIDSEFITYTSVTATAFLGCTRGIHALGGPAASHVSGSVVHGGTNFAQRLKIKSNTATTLTTDTNFPGTVTTAYTYVVEAPATTLNLANWKLNFSQFAVKDLILKPAGNSFQIGGFWAAQGCSIQCGGNTAFLAIDGTNFRSSPGSAITAIYALENVSTSPFAASENACAGFRIEGESLTPANCLVFECGVVTGANLTLIAVATSVGVCGIMSGSNLLVAYGGSFTVQDCGSATINGNSVSNPGLLQACQLIVDNVGDCRLANIVSNNAPGSAILVRNGSHAQLTNITGTGATGVGVETQSLGIAHATDTITSVTGVLGDIKCGSRQARTWTDFNSPAPASGLPSKNELDVPDFVTKPVKLVLTGLTATNSVNITTPTAPATTEAIDNPLSATASTINVVATAGFPATGYLLIGTEVISYIAVTGTSFTGCSRGQQGTTAASHALGAAVGPWNPPAASINTCRVVTAGANAGPYVVTDVGGTAIASLAGVPGVATLSDDGTTLAFAAATNLTALTVEYTPALPVSGGSRIYQG